MPTVRTVPAESPIARSYADTLTRLRAAVDTGRLELVSLGYSDPDLSTLVRESLVDDIGPQYEVGVSACFASLETTPSTGTVPAGDCAPQQSLQRLAEQGIGYVVTSESCVGWGKTKPASGAYPVAEAASQRSRHRREEQPSRVSRATRMSLFGGRSLGW